MKLMFVKVPIMEEASRMSPASTLVPFPDIWPLDTPPFFIPAYFTHCTDSV